MIRYYKEDTGDFLMVDFSPEMRNPDNMPTARASAIEGLSGSVCTTSVSLDFLREKCEPVRKTAIPREWLSRF